MSISASLTPFERACERRYPAWTLYARALTGNPLEAESVVRRAVRESPRATASETEAHEDVLRAIRSRALRRPTMAPSLLDRLKDDPREAARRLRLRFRFLPRLERRAIEMVVIQRPAKSIPDAAKKLKLTGEGFIARAESALTELAAAGHKILDDSHASFHELNAFVSGALSGDEARTLATHARSCSFCGNRLGSMMLLKANAVAKARVPWLSGSQKRTGTTLLAVGAIAAGLFAADAWWPNPWAEHATRESVPPWFHDFFYGTGRAESPTDASRALALIVDGELDAAVDILAPLERGAGATPEVRAYLGIARYLDGNVSRRTVRLLEAGTRSNRAGRLSRWYLASTFLRRRDVDSARRELEALATTSDWFGRAAKSLLDELDPSENEISA